MSTADRISMQKLVSLLYLYLQCALGEPVTSMTLHKQVQTLAILPPADWPGPSHARATLNPHWSPDGEAALGCRQCDFITYTLTTVPPEPGAH